MSFALELRGVGKRFVVGTQLCRGSVDALRSVDLELRAGDAVVIVGGPGTGKSTLLLCAAGLLHADAGELRWFGEADRAAAVDCATYYFAGSGALTRPVRRSSSRPHIHLIDGPEALSLSSASRAARWIERRCSAGDAVLVTARATDVARELAPRTMVLRGGRLHAGDPSPVAARVAEPSRV